MNARFILLLILTALLLPCVGNAREFRCGIEPEVVVEASSPAEATTVCRSAAEAIRFLAQYRLHPKRAVRVQIVEREIVSDGYDAFGSYDSRNDLVELMSYRAILDHVELPEMYGEPFDAVHYAGAVSHEVTHAVMQHNLLTKPVSPAPQEYLAHATQLAVLPAARRDRIIRTVGVGPWEPGDAISDIYMAFDQGKFAVKSYLHLTSLQNPEEFIRILLQANWFYVSVP